jgi:hypothetical protein
MHEGMPRVHEALKKGSQIIYIYRCHLIVFGYPFSLVVIWDFGEDIHFGGYFNEERSVLIIVIQYGIH